MMRLKRSLILSFFLFTSAVSPEKTRAIYNSLDPSSISEHLAFYTLYPESAEGKKALSVLQNLLGTQNISLDEPLLKDSMAALVNLVNKPDSSQITPLNTEQLNQLERIGSKLANRSLRGKHITSEHEIFNLPIEEIDLARALFLSQLGDQALNQIRTYEVSLDIMALQILQRIKPNSSTAEKVDAMNRYIFFDLGFRFPPHSLYAKDIDLYTFLPSVLDSRRGVCLGVSILYITLAQRIGLNLEMITPPGHIYVRANENGQIINIETTARGVNTPSDIYLGVDTRSLKVRNIREVIGLAHFNQASTFWNQKKPDLAVKSYEKARPYLLDDALLKELLGYNYLFSGEIEKGTALLEEIKDNLPEEAIAISTAPRDFLENRVDVEGLKSVFQPVDENRASILQKRDEILAVLNKWPEFKEGWHYLAICYLQLHRLKEGLEALKKAHYLNPHDPTTEYYLSHLYLERLDYKKAWEHLINAENITKKRNHYPKALKELRRELTTLYIQ